jgi:hypothetical protein
MLASPLSANADGVTTQQTNRPGLGMVQRTLVGRLAAREDREGRHDHPAVDTRWRVRSGDPASGGWRD